jgi:S1-C subfamily serine protease
MVVWAVVRGSPAERAGVKPGDHLLAIDGVSIKDMDAREASQSTQSEAAGRVSLTLGRGAHEYRVSIARERRSVVFARTGYKVDRGAIVPKDTTAAEVTAMESFDASRVVSSVFPLHYPTDVECYSGAFELFVLKDPPEVAVGGIEPGPAARGGLHWGDRILEADGTSVAGKTPAELERLFCTPAGQRRQLVVRRGDGTRRISFSTVRTADLLRANGLRLMEGSLVPIDVSREDTQCLGSQ